MKRKIFMLALLTAVFALLLCVGAGAVDEYDLWVNGVHVTSDNAADVLGNADEGATVKYDAATNTLTLDGAELSVLHTYDNQYYGVILARTDDPLTVNVIGDSKITVEDPGENADSIRGVCGILHDETGFAPVNKTWSINLTGTATLDIEVNYFGAGIRAYEDVDIEKLTLNVNVNKTDDITDEYGGGKFSEAIRANDTLTIENGATVNVNSVSITCPVYSENGDLVIKDAAVNVTALAGMELADGSIMGANSMYSSYGSVIITGNANVTANSYLGISAGAYIYDDSINDYIPRGGDIVIFGNAVMNSTSTADSGFWTVLGKIIIADNAQVTARGFIVGINSSGGVEITGGTLKACGETNYAIYSWEDLIIKNSIVEAISDPEYYSIGASGAVDIDDSWVSSNNGAYDAAINNSVEITGSSGQAYGDAVLPGDVTLPKDYVLVLNEGESLTIPEGVTLTNYGTIQVLGGSFTNNGTYIDYGKTIGEIKGSGDFPNNWFVTVKSGNGAADVVYRVVKGEGFTLPEAPQNSGYIFLGWRSGDATYRAGESVDITSNATFTAVWGNLPYVKPSEPETPGTPVFPFYDVTARDWYYNAVAYVYEKGLMDGVDVGVFAPNDTLTRAMVWTIIARAEGVDTTGGATWYAKAQEWVTAKGISDGENPNAAITRQELVTMLYRLAGEPAVSGTITAPDASSVSTWATNAMTWAMNIGLVEGDENGAVTPTATATRAQAAALIMRYLES